MRRGDCLASTRSEKSSEELSLHTARSASVPITALAFVQLDSFLLLLVAEGTFLSIYSISSDHCEEIPHLRSQVFHSNSIHGLTQDVHSRPGSVYSEARQFAYGAKSVCPFTLCLPLAESHVSSRDIEIHIGYESEVSDWILYGSMTRSNLEIPHYGLVLTAQNSLVALQRDVSSQFDCLIASHVCNGPTSILYSAHFVWAEAHRVLVAAGTVYGEVIVWSCSLIGSATPTSCFMHSVFRGHTGSVFGVEISHSTLLTMPSCRLLASCSDDRTIRIWLVDEKEINAVPGPASTNLSGGLGFGLISTEKETSAVAVRWAHLSRIWRVAFLPVRGFKLGSQIGLLSVGEDKACQLWTLNLKGKNETQPNSGSLEQLYTDRHHAGKNIWSVATIMQLGHLAVATGGADGRVVLRHLDSDRIRSHSSAPAMVSMAFKTVLHQLLRVKGPDDPSRNKNFSIKQYWLIKDGDIAAITDTGSFLLGDIDYKNETIVWRSFYGNRNSHPLLLVRLESDRKRLLFATGESIWETDLNENPVSWRIATVKAPLNSIFVAGDAIIDGAGTTYLLVTSRGINQATLICVSNVKEKPENTMQTILELPSTFTVSSARYLPQIQLLILGSRSGAVAIYNCLIIQRDTIAASLCRRHVHGDDSVTMIVPVGRPSPMGSPISATYLVTCGRDGTYQLHLVSKSGSDDDTHIIFETVHISSPEFGPNIEGAYLSQTQGDREQEDLILYGFRSTFFVVWNETRQFEIMNVNCGGAHRSWAYQPYADAEGNTRTNTGGTFVWTKASCVNWVRKIQVETMIVQQGGHGREIKCIAKHPSSLARDKILIATGAEDTDIRLFEMEPVKDTTCNQSRPPFRCCTVLKRHTTGLQHLQFSPCGTYLFSSAGCEEFYVWRLRSGVPFVGIGVVAWDALPKEDLDLDARITHFDIGVTQNQSVSSEPVSKPVLLIMAYSSGKLKLLHYWAGAAAGTGRFEALHQVSIGSFCLTQAIFLRHNQEDRQIISAGTNGYINRSVLPFSTGQPHSSPKQTRLQPQMHQNCVKALQIIRISSKNHLAISGGDDNAISLAIFQSSPVNPDPGFAQDEQWSAGIQDHLYILRIPSAHAAAVTAITILEVKRRSDWFQAIFASTGNDQRVKVWSLAVGIDHRTWISDSQLEKPLIFSAPSWRSSRHPHVGSAMGQSPFINPRFPATCQAPSSMEEVGVLSSFGRSEKEDQVDSHIQPVALTTADVHVVKLAECWTNVADAAAMEVLQVQEHRADETDGISTLQEEKEREDDPAQLEADEGRLAVTEENASSKVQHGPRYVEEQEKANLPVESRHQGNYQLPWSATATASPTLEYHLMVVGVGMEVLKLNVPPQWRRT